MSTTGKARYPLSSRLVTIPSLIDDFHYGNNDDSLRIIMNTYFFGTKLLKRWDGNAWVSAKLKTWNGSAWVFPKLKTWSGSEWVEV